MAVNLEFAKKHWHILAGSALAVLVLVYFYSKSSKSGAASSAGSSDISGGANQVQALSAAADLQNAQVNGQTTIAAYTASVQNNSVVAGLQSDLAKTAAELSATQSGQQFDYMKTQDQDATAVQLQKLTTDAAIAQTEIEGATLVTLSKQQNDAKVAVQLASIKAVSGEVGTLMKYSKHFDSDIQKIAPVLTAQLGLESASIAASSANAQTNVATKQASAAKVGAIAGAVSSVASGLLAGA